jgi:hypothetical protein
LDLLTTQVNGFFAQLGLPGVNRQAVHAMHDQLESYQRRQLLSHRASLIAQAIFQQAAAAGSAGGQAHRGGPPGRGRGFGSGTRRSAGRGRRGGLRVDDPLALRWPVGHEIALDVTARGTDEDQNRRALEDRRPSPRLEEVEATFEESDARTAETASTFRRPFAAEGPGDTASASAPRSFSYTVTSLGRIVLPDDLELPADGWVRHGPDFLHVDQGAVLFGDSGWIGRVRNWDSLSAALDVETLPRHRVHADATAFFLTPVDGDGRSVRIGPLSTDQNGFVTDDAGLQWKFSSLSDGRFCVEVAELRPAWTRARNAAVGP